MNNPRFLPLCLTLLLAACGSAGEQPPLAGARIGGPFALTDQNGARVSDARFKRQYRLIYFGYTFCPDVCPTTLQKLMTGFATFTKASPDRAAKVQPIFITIDPRRDTPGVMKAYVTAFSPRLIGLTGSEAEVAKVAKEFAVYYSSKRIGDATDYLVDHSSVPMLFSPDGAPIAILAADAGADAVAADLDKWVK